MPIWFVYAAIVVITWGVVGLFQKLSTNYISAESTLILVTVAFCLFIPFTLQPLSTYSLKSLCFGVLSGVLSNAGAWGLFKAMESGGKASIVTPLCSMYPVVVMALAPTILHESTTPSQIIGVVCALIAVILLAI